MQETDIPRAKSRMWEARMFPGPRRHARKTRVVCAERKSLVRVRPEVCAQDDDAENSGLTAFGAWKQFGSGETRSVCAV